GTHNMREPGGTSAHSYPGRVFPGKRMAGQFGNKKVTVKHLQVVKVDGDRNLIFVRGAVPGAKNSIIVVRKD
ncbi:MAG: 50S ribosomal protein L3, partial [Fibrobacter sp.]|nr:50S ribosomal protein L3 [Fibrobacter sp.]